ncbi:MAG: integrase core domain-containing protein [Candidatus Omnitrophota bacterium]
MSTATNYTTGNRLIHAFFELTGQLFHSDLMRQIDYLKIENKILRSKCPERVTTTADEKYLLLKFGLPLGGKIKNLINIVHYATFRRWATDSGTKKGKTQDKRGRPRIIPLEMIEMILRMAKENPGWGYPRIRTELSRLFKWIPARNTVKDILNRHGIPSSPKRNKDSWDAYIKRSFKTLWACDFFSKTILTATGPKICFALFFINIHTRKVHMAGISHRPNKEWITKIMNENKHIFEPGDPDSGKLLIRDRDRKFPKEFDEIIKSTGTEIKMLPFKSPNLNPYAEAWVGTIKRECLSYFFVFGLRHFEYLVTQYVKYYNTLRPHSSNPLNRLQEETGKIRKKSSLGGLLKHYYRN